jgi:hypothetical protein
VWGVVDREKSEGPGMAVLAVFGPDHDGYTVY